MKKITFTFAVAIIFAACNGAPTQLTTTNSTAIDSTVVTDSAVTAIDSTVAKIVTDSAK